MTSIQCMTCKFYLGLQECKAFPDGIPQRIYDGTTDHSKPYDGDNGIQWEAANAEAAELMQE